MIKPIHTLIQIIDDLYGTDHYPFIITFNESIVHRINFIAKWKFHDANWKEYGKHIIENVHTIDSCLDNLTSDKHININ